MTVGKRCRVVEEVDEVDESAGEYDAGTQSVGFSFSFSSSLDKTASFNCFRCFANHI